MPDTDTTPTAPGGGLVPAPLSIDGPYRCAVHLGEGTALAAGPGTEDTARWLRATLGAAFGLPLPPGSADAGDTLALALDPALPAEGYRLEAAPRRGVRITGGGPAGVFWGAQTLRQLLGPHAFRRAPLAPGRAAVLPQQTVEDGPRFAWRGMLLDVARHFLPKDGVLRYLDLLAAHKLNVLHLHLTDDQGWRIEIARYPELTGTGGWRERTKIGHRASPSGTSARTAATTPRTTSARSSPTPPSGTSPSSPRSTSPDTRRPPSPRTRNSATPTSSTPPP